MPRPADHPDHRPLLAPRPGTSVAEVAEFLEYLSPPAMSAPVEPFGLQVGALTERIESIVVAPMTTFSAITAAGARKNCLLITAAPLIREPLSAVREDDPIGSKLLYLIQHRVSLYCLANSFAATRGGFDETLADALGLAGTAVLKPTTYEPMYKIAVYVPARSAQAVFGAASEAGAGHVGNYSHCSFQMEGEGTFLPHEGARPAIGSIGNLERVKEIKLEMVVPQRELQGVVAAVLEAHPYEEVAYDVVAIRNPGAPFGRGRIGELPLRVSLETVLEQIHDALGPVSVRCSHRAEFPVGSMAVASGTTDGLFWSANRAGAGVLVVGGASQQELMLAEGTTTVLIDIGYGASVGPGLALLATQIRSTFGHDGLEVVYVD